MGILLSMFRALGTFIIWEVINGKRVWVSPNSFEKILIEGKRWMGKYLCVILMNLMASAFFSQFNIFKGNNERIELISNNKLLKKFK
jgi:ABC-type spermidine/putrescine transport system permease subunit I